MPCAVERIETVASGVKRFDMRRSCGNDFPVFSPGSHVLIQMQTADGHRHTNPYSLMGSIFNRQRYSISVRRDAQGRGGSKHLHDHVQVGDVVDVSQPVNLFALDLRATKYLLVAGGIGITPMISFMEFLQATRRDFELVYVCDSEERCAYGLELRQRYGSRIHLCLESVPSFPIDTILDGHPLGTQLYICGPGSLLKAMQHQAAELGWPQEAIRFERFLAPASGKPFEVTLTQSNKTFEVGAHQSLLEAIEEAGVEAPYLCRGGVCGQCETHVVSYEGELIHNDNYLSDEQKEKCQHIMPCVSRCRGGPLVLER